MKSTEIYLVLNEGEGTFISFSVEMSSVMNQAKKGFKQQRRESRAPATWAVQIEDTSKHHFSARTCNISANGLQLSSQQSFRVDDKLMLHIQAMHKNEKLLIKVIGQVVYSALGSDDNFSVGLKFISNTAAFKGFINNYVMEKNGLE